MKWVRLWYEAIHDPKLRAIARSCGEPLSSVITVYCFMLVEAARAEKAGSITAIVNEDLAAAADIEVTAVEAIRKSMHGKLHDDENFLDWQKRHVFEDDYSTPRVRKHRERKRRMELRETDGNATKADTESESQPDQHSYEYRRAYDAHEHEATQRMAEAGGINIKDPKRRAELVYFRSVYLQRGLIDDEIVQAIARGRERWHNQNDPPVSINAYDANVLAFFARKQALAWKLEQAGVTETSASDAFASVRAN